MIRATTERSAARRWARTASNTVRASRREPSTFESCRRCATDARTRRAYHRSDRRSLSPCERAHLREELRTPLALVVRRAHFGDVHRWEIDRITPRSRESGDLNHGALLQPRHRDAAELHFPLEGERV